MGQQKSFSTHANLSCSLSNTDLRCRWLSMGPFSPMRCHSDSWVQAFTSSNPPWSIIIVTPASKSLQQCPTPRAGVQMQHKGLTGYMRIRNRAAGSNVVSIGWGVSLSHSQLTGNHQPAARRSSGPQELRKSISEMAKTFVCRWQDKQIRPW